MEHKLSLVLCDIDSTLINHDRELTPKTKEIIQRLHSQGIYFGLASGRPVDELQRYALGWGFDFPFEFLIGMNGSELWDELDQKQYDSYKLKKEWIKEILEAMKPFPSNAFIYLDGKIVAQRIDDAMRHSAVTSQKPIHVIESDEELYAHDNAKIMFRMSKEQTLEVEAYFQEHSNPYYTAFKTQSTLIEFADRRVSKAIALDPICQHHAFSLENIWAFGDTTNDNTMLEKCGLGVCMANGTDDTKAIADAITRFDNDHDGVAVFIQEHYFDRMEGSV